MMADSTQHVELRITCEASFQGMGDKAVWE